MKRITEQIESLEEKLKNAKHENEKEDLNKKILELKQLKENIYKDPSCIGSYLFFSKMIENVANETLNIYRTEDYFEFKVNKTPNKLKNKKPPNEKCSINNLINLPNESTNQRNEDKLPPIDQLFPNMYKINKDEF